MYPLPHYINHVLAIQIFRESMTRLANMLNAAQSAYYNDKISQAGADTKAISEIMNEIMHRDKSVKLPTHSSAKILADKFGTFLEEKITKIQLELPRGTNLPNVAMPACESRLDYFNPVTVDELRKIVTKAPPKSCSLDPMPSWMVKSVLDELIPLMTKITNKSLSSGNVPASMKVAVVTPLLKKASLDPEIMKNYRPVSNVSFISKILEKVVATRLRDYMDINKLHDPFQSAYESGHSTETALLKVQNYLLRTMDKSGAAILVLLDRSAGFDTIDHDIMLSRLKTVLGIDGIALQWFKSYLTGRTQSMKIHDALSAVLMLIYGVPQGSVLGPLLFLVYLLPLRHLIKTHGLEMHGYADDTQIYMSCSTPNDKISVAEDCRRIEMCLHDIHSWMSNNKLKLNSEKTEIILIGTRVQVEAMNVSSLSVAGVQVNISGRPVRNLGVELDPLLSMSAQVNKMVKHSSFHIRNIGRVRRKISENSAKTLVHSLVTSRLDYCNSLLSGISEQSLSKLQLVQNNAARLVTLTKKRAHITPVLRRLHWLPVRSRVDFKVLLLVYKALHHKAPGYIRQMLVDYKPSRQLRSGSLDLLVEPRTHLVGGNRAFSNHAPRLWNRLDRNIREAPSVETFKSRLKTQLFKSYYDC